MENTLVLIKPDAVQKGVSGEIISRYEKADLKIKGIKMLNMTPELSARHYVDHIDKPYYKRLADFMVSGPMIAMVLAGENAIAKVRAINGATDPKKAEQGTIRADFAADNTINAVHASDSNESAAREIGIFFAGHEWLSGEGRE